MEPHDLFVLVQIHHLPWEGDTDSLNLQTVCIPNSVGRQWAGQASGSPSRVPSSSGDPHLPLPGDDRGKSWNTILMHHQRSGAGFQCPILVRCLSCLSGTLL